MEQIKSSTVRHDSDGIAIAIAIAIAMFSTAFLTGTLFDGCKDATYYALLLAGRAGCVRGCELMEFLH